MSDQDDSDTERRERRRTPSRTKESGSSNSRESSRNKKSTSSNGHRSAPSPASLARRAVSELADLIGYEVEGIVSLQRSDDGWSVGVQVLETQRIPNTSDVLAEYEVNTDERGQLMGYQRVRRYVRGSTRDEQ